MTTARDIMSTDVHTVREDQSLVEAAQIMREQGVGALPVMDNHGALIGIVTDRDVVIEGVATGRDLAATAISVVSHGIVSTVSPDEDVQRIVDTMGDQQIKRVPVLQGSQLVGMISESDLARHVAEDRIAHFVKMVYGRG